ncbi:hypothetical protein E5S67_06221 [Microcoleus sp. IPMA8]|uniref:Uncharacterized protein n=1 Tax=Microcoleus asticus IPMA8 TaxID=2563858 RepID=A0ABX2D794_9CYAN|nr:hypothetical protein [Microcoleus asticus]NQE38436.1 hypothetical protein [Microcoleus asticus IPMA8]
MAKRPSSEFEVKLHIQSPPTPTKEFLSLLERDFVCIVAVETAEGSRGVVLTAEGSSNESGFGQIFDRTLAAGWIVEKRSGIFPAGRSHLGHRADVSTELAKDFFTLRIGCVAQRIILKD